MIGPAEILRESFRSFESRGGGIGPKNGKAVRPKGIGNPGDERSFGPDDDEIDSVFPRKLDDCSRIAWIGSDTVRPPCNPGITR